MAGIQEVVRSLFFGGEPTDAWSVSIAARRHRKSRGLSTETLEVRQLLTGDLLLARSLGGTSADSVSATAVDTAGNIYLTGSFFGVADFDPGPGVTNLTSAGSSDIFVTKLDSAGNLLWARRMGGTDTDTAADLVIDAAGNVLTTGSFRGSADFDPAIATITELVSSGTSDIFVSKLNSAGNFVWARRMGSTTDDGGSAIGVDAAGNVYTTGIFSGTADFDPNAAVTFNLVSAGGADVFVSRLDSSGSFGWAKRMGGTGSDVGQDLTVADSGGVLITGNFSTTADFDPGVNVFNLFSTGSTDVFVCQLQNDGQFVWARGFGGTGSDQGAAVTVDTAGNVFAAGGFELVADFDPGGGVTSLVSHGSVDVFAMKLTATGNLIWARGLGASEIDVASGIALDAADSLYLTGRFAGTVDFDPGAGVENLTSTSGTDVFVSKLDSAGNAVWNRRFGGPGDNSGNAIAVDAAGQIHVAGTFAGTVDFDPDAGIVNLTSNGSNDVFLLKLSPDMLFTAGAGIAGDLRLRRNGDWLELALNGTGTAGQYVLQERHRLSAIPTVLISGNANGNSLTLDFQSGGSFVIDGGLRFFAGAGISDAIRLIGVGNEGFVYRASSTTSGSGTFQTYSGEVTFTGVESSFVRNTQHLVIETQGSTDVLTAAATIGFQGHLATSISGTGDGTAMPSLTFDTVRDLTIETGLNDGILPESHDLMTINAAALQAQALKNVFVRTGKGNDSLIVNGPNIGLPVVDGSFWFLGGADVDQLTAIGDTNWNLNDLRLVSGGGGRLQMDDIEKAALTGGASKNHLDASLYSGSAILDGAGNNDLLRGGSGRDTLFGGVGNDRLFGGSGDDVLNGQDGNDLLFGDSGDDTLFGQTGTDQLWGGDDDDFLSGDAGDDVLQGGNGNDVLNGGDQSDRLFGDAGTDTLNGGNGDDLLNGGADNDLLTGGAGNDLIELQGTNNAEDLQLLRVSAVSATFRRKPRGLAFVLEQDSVSMDATDEFLISALDGDDQISIDALFTQLGSVDGGNGVDTCTAPAAWTRVSC